MLREEIRWTIGSIRQVGCVKPLNGGAVVGHRRVTWPHWTLNWISPSSSTRQHKRHALLWQAAEEKRLLAEQRKATAAERKEEKRLLAYRKKLAKFSNDQLRKLLQRKIARKKPIDQTKYFTIPPEKVRQSLEKLSYREHVYSGRWLEESFRAVQFPPNEYHRERRVFAPPINRLSRDAQHRAWNGYEWEIV